MKALKSHKNEGPDEMRNEFLSIVEKFSHKHCKHFLK